MESKKTNCSVGILTYNSAKGIRRCLESVKDFAEIIIADGGSTDETLSIAREFGAIIISQSNPGHPIEDFSKERQLTLDKASLEWFFYLDSDEIISDGLQGRIREVTNAENCQHLVYKVKYQLTNRDFSKVYVSYKPYYQTRLFNKKSGAKFIKKMHERITFDKSLSVGTINEPWYVPLDDQLDFKVYKSKVDYRLRILAQEYGDPSVLNFLKKAVTAQSTAFIKQLYKIVTLRVREGCKNVVPIRYEIFRLYSPLRLFVLLTARYFQIITRKSEKAH